jgi:biopolymer transport protein ExbB
MNLTQKFLAFTLLGAGWVLWLLVGLSVVSVAIMLERALYLSSRKLPDGLLAELKKLLFDGNVEGARKLLSGRGGIEAQVALEGLEQLPRGAGAVAEAMTGARTRERLHLERNLAVLGTLGNNAPFIGLFGTVLGIIKAFHDLSQNQGGGAAVVMSGISEALVATAVGLIVAIPAVMAFNFFQRRVRARLARADELAHAILATIRKESA